MAKPESPVRSERSSKQWRDMMDSRNTSMRTAVQIRAHKAFEEADSDSKRHYFRKSNLKSFSGNDLPTRSTEDIRLIYSIVNKAEASGAFGSVSKGFLKIMEDDRIFAIKKIERNPEDDLCVMDEIEILKTLDHPNVIRFYEVYEDAQFFYLVLEYCQGGDLFDRMKEVGIFSEQQAKEFLLQILLATSYIHSRKIAHMDIKPENFLLLSKDSNSLKMIDFGLSKSFKDYTIMEGMVGTCQYMAPQVIDEGYSEKCDIWSIGVIMYIMLTGKFPFDGDTQDEIFKNILDSEYDLEIIQKKKISHDGILFLQSLLAHDEYERLDAAEALRHPWLEKEISAMKAEGFKLLRPEHITNLDKFTISSSYFQREISRIMVQAFNDAEEISTIKKIFLSLDFDFKGRLCKESLRLMFNSLSMETTDEYIEYIVDTLYIRKKGVVTFLEFEAGLLPRSFFLDEKRLRILFAYLDVSKNGKITQSDIYRLYKRFGWRIDKSKVLRMIEEADYDKNGVITIDEIAMVLDGNHG